MAEDKKRGLSEDERVRIAARINEVAKNGCPRCGTDDFILIDGYANFSIQDRIDLYDFTGPVMPCVMALCKNCGFVSIHSMGILGLLPPVASAKIEG